MWAVKSKALLSLKKEIFEKHTRSSPRIFSFCELYWPQTVVQIVFIVWRRTRRYFGRKGRRYLVSPQRFWHLPVPASNCASQQRVQQKSFAIKLFQFCYLQTKQRLKLQEEMTFLRNQEGFQKTTQFFYWQIARFSRNFQKSEEVFTNSNIETQNWNWMYRFKRYSLCSLQ